MRDLKEEDIQAILGLLSDSDPEVVQAVRLKLLEMGREVILQLRGAAGSEGRASSELDFLLGRADECPLEEQFENLRRTPEGDVDLEEGAFLLAKFGYPDVVVAAYADRIDQIASDLAPRTSAGDHPIWITRTLNAYLFREQGFGPGAVLDPDNSFMNRVLDRKIGIPITLSSLYLLVGRRLGLPLYGVGMPGHFIVKYQDEDAEIFLDPYNGGRVITKNECREIVHRLGHPFSEEDLAPTPDRDILIRMINNLLHIYLSKGDEEKMHKLLGYRHILRGGNSGGGPRRHLE